jgi:hypothetical protein
MKISYAITVCNEREEIEKLLSQLFMYIRPEDEVVVLYDEKNGDPKVWEYLNLVALTDDNQFKGFKIYSSEFHGHFANWKNKLNSLCTGEVIVNIDADEIPHKNLIYNLPALLEANPSVDMLRVPRVNTVEGLTEEHIKKWGWRVNEKGWVNWADWQMRIYRRHPDIKWKNKVHEILDGFKIHGMLPMEEEWALYHPKDIKKQEKQNNYYDTL